MVLTKIISGGQTGADLGALVAAKMYGIPTGGYMPKGFRNHAGNMYNYSSLFDMQEHSSPGYKDRTFDNSRISDATLRIALDFNTAGEKCTLNGIKYNQKLYRDVQLIQIDGSLHVHGDDSRPSNIAEWILDNRICTLNVAGNSDRTHFAMGRKTIEFISEILYILTGREQSNTDKIKWFRFYNACVKAEK